MSHLNRIFAIWADNAETLAADVGETGVTVRAWRNRNSIHSDHWPRIIKAAAARGVDLLPEDFWPPEVVADLPSHGRHHSVASGCGSATNASANIGSWPIGEAAPNNSGENIRRAGEADSHGPFSVSPSTCSTTRAPNAPSLNPACSTGEAEAA